MKAFSLCCAVLGVLGFASTPQGRDALVHVQDAFDRRPVRHVLIIGNSRTYFHQMPWMLRQIDDSSRAPTRLDITTLAWGGASFEDNWNNADVRRALARHWDQIILQPESRSESGEQNHDSFSTYGAKLITAGREGGSPVALIINWGYGEELWDGDLGARRTYIERLEDAERTLASECGAQVIDTSAVWETVHAAAPTLPLYEDGNHPTVYGSYLSALMLDGFLSGRTVAATTYTPSGSDTREAAIVRNAVLTYYAS